MEDRRTANTTHILPENPCELCGAACESFLPFRFESCLTLLLRNVLALDRMGEMMVFCCKGGWQERAGERNRRTPPKVARTASAFLARSAEGEAPSYGSNAAALSLYSQQRGDMEPARLAP